MTHLGPFPRPPPASLTHTAVLRSLSTAPASRSSRHCPAVPGREGADGSPGWGSGCPQTCACHAPGLGVPPLQLPVPQGTGRRDTWGKASRLSPPTDTVGAHCGLETPLLQSLALRTEIIPLFPSQSKQKARLLWEMVLYSRLCPLRLCAGLSKGPPPRIPRAPRGRGFSWVWP